MADVYVKYVHDRTYPVPLTKIFHYKAETFLSGYFVL